MQTKEENSFNKTSQIIVQEKEKTYTIGNFIREVLEKKEYKDGDIWQSNYFSLSDLLSEKKYEKTFKELKKENKILDIRIKTLEIMNNKMAKTEIFNDVTVNEIKREIYEEYKKENEIESAKEILNEAISKIDNNITKTGRKKELENMLNSIKTEKEGVEKKINEIKKTLKQVKTLDGIPNVKSERSFKKKKVTIDKIACVNLSYLGITNTEKLFSFNTENDKIDIIIKHCDELITINDLPENINALFIKHLPKLKEVSCDKPINIARLLSFNDLPKLKEISTKFVDKKGQCDLFIENCQFCGHTNISDILFKKKIYYSKLYSNAPKLILKNCNYIYTLEIPDWFAEIDVQYCCSLKNLEIKKINDKIVLQRIVLKNNPCLFKIDSMDIIKDFSVYKEIDQSIMLSKPFYKVLLENYKMFYENKINKIAKDTSKEENVADDILDDTENLNQNNNILGKKLNRDNLKKEKEKEIENDDQDMSGKEKEKEIENDYDSDISEEDLDKHEKKKINNNSGSELSKKDLNENKNKKKKI